MSVESPEYEVLRREGSLELRRYRPYLIASVTARASGYSEATYAGFGLLADYIFGNNTAAGSIAMTVPVTASRASGTKIAMTAPVTSERVRSEQLDGASPLCTVHCAGEYEVRFTMPSRFGSVDELPRPNDGRVRLDAVPEHLAVVSRFGGRLNDPEVASAVEQLGGQIRGDTELPQARPDGRADA